MSPGVYLLAIVLSASLASSTRASDCPGLPGASPEHCVASAQGWFYADTADAAAQLAADAGDAAALFRRYFGRAAPRGAVLASGVDIGVKADQSRALRAAGANWVLPWLNPEEQRRLMRDRIRAQVVQQLGEDASEALIEQALEQAMTQTASASQSEETTGRSAVRHEIGHMLLIAAFWPDAGQAGSGHYGGPGPDWLDEVAAVLMEDEAMTASRRSWLRQTVSAAEPEQALLPLSEFFAAAHPLAAWAEENRLRMTAGSDSQPGGASVHVMRGEQARLLADRGIAFYGQSRGVADFLIEQSSSEGVFGEIAHALASGESLEDWLAAHGEGHNLPATINELEALWTHWIGRLSSP